MIGFHVFLYQSSEYLYWAFILKILNNGNTMIKIIFDYFRESTKSIEKLN